MAHTLGLSFFTILYMAQMLASSPFSSHHGHCARGKHAPYRGTGRTRLRSLEHADRPTGARIQVTRTRSGEKTSLAVGTGEHLEETGERVSSTRVGERPMQAATEVAVTKKACGVLGAGVVGGGRRRWSGDRNGAPGSMAW